MSIDFSRPFSLDELKAHLEDMIDTAGSSSEDETHSEEIEALKTFISDVEDYSNSDFIVPDEYFKTYAQETAEGTMDKNIFTTWPTNCIDWDEAASVLQADFTEIDYDGMTFWVQ